jgi:hypothetical protein
VASSLLYEYALFCLCIHELTDIALLSDSMENAAMKYSYTSLSVDRCFHSSWVYT